MLVSLIPNRARVLRVLVQLADQLDAAVELQVVGERLLFDVDVVVAELVVDDAATFS